MSATNFLLCAVCMRCVRTKWCWMSFRSQSWSHAGCAELVAVRELHADTASLCCLTPDHRNSRDGRQRQQEAACQHYPPGP